MTLYQEVTILFPYLHSIRKLKTHLSIDVTFPNSWKLPKKYIPENSIVENESQLPDHRFFSFVSEFEEQSVDNILSNIQNVIRYNKEREEKEKLFDDKVSELRKMFDKQNLDNLKNLKFDITSKKVEFEDEELTDAEPATN
jgi:hypothetical protein